MQGSTKWFYTVLDQSTSNFAEEFDTYNFEIYTSSVIQFLVISNKFLNF